MSALDIQVGGSHYKDCAIQPIQYIEANNLKFLEACVIKRCTRHDKPTGKGRQDIEKAIHELQLLLDMRYPVDVKAEPLTAEELGFDEERADIIGQNGNDGEHYIQAWIRWDGGQQPEDEGTIVDCLLRGGGIITRPAGSVDWSHSDHPGDVMRYMRHA